jgi:ribosomal protein S18 acetylase RimI-like enzyme
MQSREIVIQPASEVSPDAFTQALNLAYTDYYVPISLTPSSFERLVERESVDLSASAAAVEGYHIVGVGMLGVRGDQGWIGGLGVIPQSRRHGVGRLLMEHLIAQARRLNLSTLRLEVIVENSRAHMLYQSLGFKTTRTLLVLIHYGDPSLRFDTSSPFTVKKLAVGAALDTLPNLIHSPRAWQRETPALEAMASSLNALGVWDADNRLAGVALYRMDAGQVGIMDLASATPEAGKAMLLQILKEGRGDSISYVNVPDDHPLLPVLYEYEFVENLSQYEMVLDLSSEASQ